MEEIIRSVYKHPFITQNDLDDIANAHSLLEVEKGSILLKKGLVSDCYYLLEKGLVRAYVHDFNANEITTEFFTEGEVVIVPSSLFQRIPSAEYLQAVTECKLWKIDFDNFQQLFNKIDGIKEWGRAWFTFQLFHMKQRSLDMVTKSATDRYKKLLADKPDVLKYAPLKDVASYLGITDSSLSRIRREFFVKR